MKHFLPILLLLTLVPGSKLLAQSGGDWQPVYLQVTGHNETDGVYAWFKHDECEGEDVVFIKLENKNPYPVDVNFFNAVFTQKLEWIKKEDTRRTLTLDAKESIVGSCSASGDYKISLSDFVADASEFKRFSTYEFTVKPVR